MVNPRYNPLDDSIIHIWFVCSYNTDEHEIPCMLHE
jgi:hypothetical protein